MFPNKIMGVVTFAVILSLSQNIIAVNICTGLISGTLVRDVQNCSNYFHCFNGVPVPMECPKGKLFNQSTRTCEVSKSVDCFKCPANVIFVDMPVTNECQQFVRCFNKQPEQLTCADGLYFDSKTNTCNLQNATMCEFKVVCPIYSDRPIFTRNPTQCSKYFICLNGIPLGLSCPNDLQFNTITNQCDLPKNVGCNSVKSIVSSTRYG